MNKIEVGDRVIYLFGGEGTLLSIIKLNGHDYYVVRFDDGKTSSFRFDRVDIYLKLISKSIKSELDPYGEEDWYE